VNFQSVEQVYSSKTDDELLALSADAPSLRDDAKEALIRELQHRGLGAAGVANYEAGQDSTRAGRGRHFLRSLKFGGILILNAVVAILGTAALEGEIGSAIHPRSISGLLWKWWSLDLICAAVLGFLVWRKWKVQASIWTWVVPAAWFGLGFTFALMSREEQSVLAAGHGLWYQFSGADCQNGYLSGSGCVNFWVFTAPCVRSVSYSIGAYISSRIKTNSQHQQTVTSVGGQAAQ
jgi:hypothetical protein